MTTLEGFGGVFAEFTGTPGTTVVRQGQSGPPPPAVSWIAPGDSDNVSGNVGLLVAVTSQVSVTGVDFLDASNSNALVGHATLGAFGWLVTWDSTGVADGARSIAAKATDSNGQTATVTIGVAVANSAPPPSLLTCNIITPADGATVTGNAGFAVATTDNSPHTVTGVQLFANNVLIGTATLGAFGWGFGWDTSGVTNGTYTVRATATDSTLNTASSTITVHVQNVAAPTVTIAAPAAGSTVTGHSVLLAATARSTIAISGVQFFMDNVLVGNATLAGFAWTLTCDSALYTNGLHLLKAVATDTLSQTGELTVAVTVANTAPSGILMPIQAGGPSTVIDNTDTTESTVGIRNWIAQSTGIGDVIVVQPGTYWVDGPIFAYGARTIKAQDPLNPPVFHRHTVYPYRIKPDTRATFGTVNIRAAVPAYWFPPSGFDTELDTNAAQVAFAVINPNSGPDTSGPQAVFTTQIANNHTAGIKCYGYVHTSFGARALADVELDIDRWYNWYGIDGIFLDEVPDINWSSGVKTYYQTIRSYINAKSGANVLGNIVVMNPGTVTDEFAMSVSDIVCDFEDIEANYAAATFPAWRLNYASDRFYHIILRSGGVTQMQNDVTLAATRHIGYMYVTTAGGSNPYNVMPSTSFWTSEKAAFAAAGQPNPAYNQNGRACNWQYDILGGQAAIPTSLGNPNAGANPALGASNGGYDAKTLRSSDGTQIIGLQSLYGALWGPGDKGQTFTYLVSSVNPNNFICASVAADGKSLTFQTPIASTSTTHEGSEGTVAWARTQSGGGWKIEHQTNDLLSFYVGPTANHPWSGFQNAILACVRSSEDPIFLATDASPVVLDGLAFENCNPTWHSTILGFVKSWPLENEFARCIETQSANQVVQNCELSYAWGAGENGPHQSLNNHIHHVGMQCAVAHYTNKLIDGGVWEYSHHSIIDIEAKDAVSNVTIQNLNVGGPNPFLAYSSEVDGLTIKNIQSTTALVGAGTINAVTNMWASGGDKGYATDPTTGLQYPGQNHLITGCEFDTSNHLADPAIQITNVAGLTVTNNKIPTSAVFVKYGTSTNVTSSGNDGGSGVGSTTQKAP